MNRNLVVGLCLALGAALTVLLGEAWGLELVHVAILGLSLGAVIALVDDRTFGVRVGGLLIGTAITWLGFGLRAGFLPDSDLGRAIDFFVVFAAIAAVAAFSAGRIPLWTMLVGAAAVAGSYEATYTANPPLFTSESLTAVTSVLLACAIGLVVAVAAGGVTATSRHGAHENRAHENGAHENRPEQNDRDLEDVR